MLLVIIEEGGRRYKVEELTKCKKLGTWWMLVDVAC